MRNTRSKNLDNPFKLEIAPPGKQKLEELRIKEAEINELTKGWIFWQTFTSVSIDLGLVSLAALFITKDVTLLAITAIFLLSIDIVTFFTSIKHKNHFTRELKPVELEIYNDFLSQIKGHEDEMPEPLRSYVLRLRDHLKRMPVYGEFDKIGMMISHVVDFNLNQEEN